MQLPLLVEELRETKVKTVNNLSCCFSKLIFEIVTIVFILAMNNLAVLANIESRQVPRLDVYKVDLGLLNNFDVIKKGTTIDFVLLSDIFTNNSKENKIFNLQLPVNEDLDLMASGFISKVSGGKRLSMFSNLQLATDKLVFNDGQQIYFSATSPVFCGVHPPHANSSSIQLARYITTLSAVSGPLTFGTSLGVGFLLSGLLSAYQNGISDFFWGGIDGSGLSFLERILRRQPEIYLTRGTVVPFTLKEDLKVSKGLHKEEIEHLNISKEEAISKVQKLLSWGDLSGAIELSVRFGQEDIYNEIIKKISFEEAAPMN